MNRLLLAACLLAAWTGPIHSWAAGPDVSKTLKGIQDRYNNSKTLSLHFTETLISPGGRHKPESGTLYLRKPRQMRWEYTAPPGDLFVSDGKFTYYLIANENKVEREKLTEGEDLRGPLAFLLGNLDFNRDFKEYRTGDADGAITAIPKSDKLEYTEVTLVPGADFSIKKLSIKGQDGSTYQFEFDDEKRNPALPDNLFKFTPPPGAVMVDAAQGNPK
ncbi:MAG TPA: outer membrane lipoprotein carrier protein LolA [Bryobacteraceae bacterium]|jgi:outer membrane lipoprotein carrier protein